MSIRYIGPVAIEIHDEVLFLEGGIIKRWTNEIGVMLQARTVESAPRNKRDRKFPREMAKHPPGFLKANITTDVFYRGRKVIGIDTTSNAPYSIFVIKGTKDQYKRNAAGQFGFNDPGGFPLPENNYGKFRRKQKIRGQAAEDFLSRGLSRTAEVHPSLRGAGKLHFF